MCPEGEDTRSFSHMYITVTERLDREKANTFRLWEIRSYSSSWSAFTWGSLWMYEKLKLRQLSSGKYIKGSVFTHHMFLSLNHGWSLVLLMIFVVGGSSGLCTILSCISGPSPLDANSQHPLYTQMWQTNTPPDMPHTCLWEPLVWNILLQHQTFELTQ